MWYIRIIYIYIYIYGLTYGEYVHMREVQKRTDTNLEIREHTRPCNLGVWKHLPDKWEGKRSGCVQLQTE